MIIREISAAGILTRSNIPNTDLVVNPYIGCEHGCIYCYAEFMKRFTNHREPWGSFLDIKINADSLVKPKGKYHKKRILFSSVTDPYLPHESKYKITRKILQKLISHQPSISILTKSELITRDIDILKQFKTIEVGISVSTTKDELAKQLEPHASSPLKRFAALKKCRDSGLKTYIFISPIFPYISDIGKIMKLTENHADYYMFENLNLRPTNRKKIFDFIKEFTPHLIEKYKVIYNKPYDLSYWDQLSVKIEELSKIFNVRCINCFHHGGFSKSKGRNKKSIVV